MGRKSALFISTLGAVALMATPALAKNEKIAAVRKYVGTDFGQTFSQGPAVNISGSYDLPLGFTFNPWLQIGTGSENGPDSNDFANELDLLVDTPRLTIVDFGEDKVTVWATGGTYLSFAAGASVPTLAVNARYAAANGFAVTLIAQAYGGDLKKPTGEHPYRFEADVQLPTLALTEHVGLQVGGSYVNFESEKYDFFSYSVNFPIEIGDFRLTPFVNGFFGNESPFAEESDFTFGLALLF